MTYPAQKQVCQLDENGFFIGTTVADLSPLEAEQGVYLLPANCIEASEPKFKQDNIAKWTGENWEYLPDHRGKTAYSTETGEAQVITEMGEVQEGLTFIAPPSELHRWNGKKWVLDKTAQSEKIQEKRTALIENIDDVAAQIYARWNRFKTEYEEREKAALAFKEADFTGEPNFFITSFSHSAGLDNRSAAELILRQAQGLRHLLEQLAALRMRKYELKNPELNLEQLQQLHDDIVQAMNQLAEAV